jgi:phosphatidylinositol kinase/protein kinase (PI-3  family)
VSLFEFVLSKLSICSFKILITGDNSGLVETITDAVSVHSIKKSEYARRIAEGNLGNVTLLDHFVHVSVPA